MNIPTEVSNTIMRNNTGNVILCKCQPKIRSKT